MSARPSLFDELKRRNVLRASAAYLALGWVVTQVTATVAPMMNLPAWIGPVVLWIGIIGFPFLVMFAWIYEITPEGLKRESEVVRDESITRATGRRFDYAVIALMVVGIGLFAYDRMNPRAGPPAAPTSASAQSAAPASPAPSEPEVSERSIAVLPFENMSSDKEQEYFSDGISEALLGAGRAEDALTEALKDPSEFARLGVLPAVYHALGRKADSDAALVELVAKHGQSAAATVATIHAFRSDADLAFQWLAKAEERNEPVSHIHVDRSFVNVRSDPRWLPLLRKHGIAPEQLAKIEFKFVLPGDGGVKASG